MTKIAHFANSPQYSIRSQAFMAPCYAQQAIVWQKIAERLAEYHQFQQVQPPAVIINYGATDDSLDQHLQQVYPSADYHAIKYLSPENQHIKEPSLPAADLLVSNGYLQRVYDWRTVAEQWKSCLKPNGQLFISTLSALSLPQWTESLDIHFNPLPNIKELGDLFHALGFVDTVLFAERMMLTYQQLGTLYDDLRITGGLPHLTAHKGLRTPHWLDEVESFIKSHCFYDDVYHFEIEILYLSAKNSPTEAVASDQAGVAYFPVEILRQKGK